MWQNIQKIIDEESRSISAENPTGLPNAGALEVPEDGNHASGLGKGWKVRPCITLNPLTTTEIASIDGSGIIRHIWMTITDKAYRKVILRMYWDDEQIPSVEVPIGDFFSNHHGIRYNVNSSMIAVNPSGGFNCYWPMPFKKKALITIENLGNERFDGFFYQIDYSLTSVSSDDAYFHARWNRSMTKREYPEHVVLSDIKGTGHYVGTSLGWNQFSNGWWGEGEVKFFVDGEENPSICTTGTEDYFGGAWCFGNTYSGLYTGYPLWDKKEGSIIRHGLYRWHIQDAIRFKRSLKVTVQALGWWPNGKFQPLTDDIDSVAYWYQIEPHTGSGTPLILDSLWPR